MRPRPTRLGDAVRQQLQQAMPSGASLCVYFNEWKNNSCAKAAKAVEQGRVYPDCIWTKNIDEQRSTQAQQWSQLKDVCEAQGRPCVVKKLEPLKIPWLIDCYRDYTTWFTGDYDNP